jgi:hypothetical protein
MATVYVKGLPSDFGVFMWLFKEGLKAAGCIHWSSGSGTGGTFTTTAGNVNDVLTSGEKFARNYSWWQGYWADGRQISIQKGNGNDNDIWRVVYSIAATFVGGSPSATVARTATDQQYVIGDASNYWYLFNYSQGGITRIKAMIQDAAPYGFWLWGHPAGGAYGSCQLFKDPLADGTYAPTDPDPYIWGGQSISSGSYRNWAYGSDYALSFYSSNMYTGGSFGYLNGIWTCIPALTYSDATTYNMIDNGMFLSTNPYTGKDEMLPVMYARYAGYPTVQGFKGVSTLFRWLGIQRSIGSTLTKDSARDRIVLGRVSAPWDGSIPEV